ncbi:hypothetical protein DFH09DRAFT_1187570 [Mycena vulgaris]|nr:hypothetical protein DFH09DRAFT_1187570 [Mycena vulgaris]
MSHLTAFIIGAGANVGKHTAAALKAKGYQVALGSRKPVFDQVKKDGYFPVAVDAQSIESVKAAFATINKELGPPKVVIFNAATFTPPTVSGDPLTLPVESLAKDTGVALAVFAAAQEALRGFRSEVHKDTQTTFIVTGNPLPWLTSAEHPEFQNMLSLNVEKVMEWRFMEIFASAYAKENSRFYYASIVSETGGVLNPLSQFFTSGPQHAKVYLNLVTQEDQTDWDYRFTLKGEKWTKE